MTRGTMCRCYVVDKITGRIVSEHDSITDAGEKLGFDSSVSRYVRERWLPDRTRYTVRLAGDYDPHESFEGKRRGVPVVASRGSEIHVSVDRAKLAKIVGVTKKTFDICVATGRQTRGGWLLRLMPRMGALNGILGLEEQ